MERVETLLKKLQEQFEQKTPVEQMLLTVQMLQAELIHYQTSNISAIINPSISIPLTQNTIVNLQEEKETEQPIAQIEEKTVEILQVDEEEIEAELEEIKRNAEIKQQISIQNKPHILFDEEEDIPTLNHQKPIPATKDKKEINEINANSSSSLNEKLKQTKIDLGDTLTEVPIRDLRKAIGVNDRYLFINELFRGDEVAYERSIKTINGFSIYAEAEYWIQRELKVKNGWDTSNEMVKQFNQLIKRRFS